MLFVVVAGLVHHALAPTPRTFGAARDNREIHESIKPITRERLSNVPGKELVAVEVLFPPGASASPHTHPAFVYAYVLSGEVVSAVGEAKPRLYRPGESWSEPPGARHRVTRNASKRLPARLLAIFVADTGTARLVQTDED